MRRYERLQDFAVHRLLHPAAPGLIIPQQQSGRTELADSGIALLRRALADCVEQPAREVVLADRRDLQDRKSVVEGKSVSVRVGIGGRRHITKKSIEKNQVTD